MCLEKKCVCSEEEVIVFIERRCLLFCGEGYCFLVEKLTVIVEKVTVFVEKVIVLWRR